MAQVFHGDARAWRDLTEAAIKPEGRAGELGRLAKATAGKVIPAASTQDQAAFTALQAFARAYAVAPAERRKRLAPCLSGLAKECAAAGGWDAGRVQKAPPAEPQTWRTDLFDFG